MKRMVNGKEVPNLPDNNGNLTVQQVKQAANIPNDRALVLQCPSGNSFQLPGKGSFHFPEGYSIIDVPAHRRGEGHRALSPVLFKHLSDVSHGGPLLIDQNYRYYITEKLLLPEGYNWRLASMLIEIPEDYPFSPPGCGNSKIFFPRGLRYHGLKPEDFHEDINFRDNKSWCWWCYEHINWDPNWDDLITLTEMVRADMANPSVKGVIPWNIF